MGPGKITMGVTCTSKRAFAHLHSTSVVLNRPNALQTGSSRCATPRQKVAPELIIHRTYPFWVNAGDVPWPHPEKGSTHAMWGLRFLFPVHCPFFIHVVCVAFGLRCPEVGGFQPPIGLHSILRLLNTIKCYWQSDFVGESNTP